MLYFLAANDSQSILLEKAFSKQFSPANIGNSIQIIQKKLLLKTYYYYNVLLPSLRVNLKKIAKCFWNQQFVLFQFLLWANEICFPQKNKFSLNTFFPQWNFAATTANVISQRGNPDHIFFKELYFARKNFKIEA